MIEESGTDHWTDREADAGLTVLPGLPAGLPAGFRAAASPWERRAPWELRERAHGMPDWAAQDEWSSPTFRSPSC
ncbi:hypothetical protein ACF068_05145 [Streptomyces sp. NPDC016309]|uniref:hypothetical protein n=1 Tax=Streptomyces sp. NPDC016309 TaxID=3364965 RepID=UPI0036F95537